jgi:hypothetical protein
VARLRAPRGVLGERWNGTDLSVQLAPARGPRVLMLSQLYRPGWQAQLSDGRTVGGYRLFGGFTGFDLPPGVDSATVSFEPTTRIVLTGVTWATVFIAMVAMLALALARARRRLPAGSKRSGGREG